MTNTIAQLTHGQAAGGQAIDLVHCLARGGQAGQVVGGILQLVLHRRRGVMLW